MLPTPSPKPLPPWHARHPLPQPHPTLSSYMQSPPPTQSRPVFPHAPLPQPHPALSSYMLPTPSPHPTKRWADLPCRTLGSDASCWWRWTPRYTTCTWWRANLGSTRARSGPGASRLPVAVAHQGQPIRFIITITIIVTIITIIISTTNNTIILIAFAVVVIIIITDITIPSSSSLSFSS